MKCLKKDRIAIVEAPNAALFEAELNRRLDELEEYSPRLEIEHHQPHTAYIFYTLKKYIPETIADEFHLKGINYKCSDCGYCKPILNKDGSVNQNSKYATCSKAERKRIAIDFDACDTFYFELVNKTGQFAKEGTALPDTSVKSLEGSTDILRSEQRQEQKNTIVADNLKRLRKDKGVTQAEIAKALGFSVSAYHSWETGANSLRGASLGKVIEYFGCTVDDLITRKDA